MRKNNKFISKNYYVSPLPDKYLAKLQKRDVILAIVSAVLLLPVLVIWIYPGAKSLIWIYTAYEANIAFLLIYALAFIGIVFCAVNNFFGYRMRREVKQKDAPFLGFKKMSYNGQFFAAVLVSLFAVYMLVLFIGYHIADNIGYIDKIIAGNKDLAGKSGGFDGAGLAMLIISIFAAAAAWLYYICAYKANKVMQYVRVDADEKDKSNRPVKRVKPKSVFSLTPEEIEEASLHEFESPDRPQGKEKDEGNEDN